MLHDVPVARHLVAQLIFGNKCCVVPLDDGISERDVGDLGGGLFEDEQAVSILILGPFKPRANEIRLAAIDDEILVPVYTLIPSWIEFQSFEPIPTNIPVLDPVRDSFELPYIDRAL